MSGGVHRETLVSSAAKRKRGRDTMDRIESLSHTRRECKYHVVFIPKCRRRTLYRELRQHLGEVFKQLAGQKESRVEEGT